MRDRSIPVRLPAADLERFEVLAAALSARAGGLRVSRSELMRLIFARGVAVLEAELDATPEAPKRKAKG